MKKVRSLVAVIAVAMTVASASLAVAQPLEESESPHTALLALPSEMQELDMPVELIQNQERVLARLTPDEVALQEELRENASEFTAPTNIVDLRAPSGSVITPYTYSAPCTSSLYKVYSQTQGSKCYRGTGTYILPTPAGLTDYVRPGQTHGRVMYFQAGPNATYWSVWRGPSASEYWFGAEAQITVYRVQIDACYTAVAC